MELITLVPKNSLKKVSAAPHSMWDVSSPTGTEPMPPALEGRVLTTLQSVGKISNSCILYISWQQYHVCYTCGCPHYWNTFLHMEVFPCYELCLPCVRVRTTCWPPSLLHSETSAWDWFRTEHHGETSSTQSFKFCYQRIPSIFKTDFLQQHQ